MTVAEKWVPSVRYRGDHLLLLDQQQLPHHTVYLNVTSIEHVWDAISKLKVRGAPAIGITAAFGLALWSNQEKENDLTAFLSNLQKQSDFLASSRPTAVNLFWAIKRILTAAQTADSVEDAKRKIETEALNIQTEDENTCRKIGEYALSLLQDGDAVMTICNAGAIATSKYGTALAPFHLAKEKGWNLAVYANETRPVLQGSRLTAWELQANDIDVTLITDNMAAHTLLTKNIKAVIVGCDRVAANGDTANKIGTFGLALQAKALGVPFFVACPLSTLDLETSNGNQIPIEERPEEEVTHLNGVRIAPEGVKVFNPAFDVTPAEYISAIITEEGIVTGNYIDALSVLKNR